MFKNMKIGFRLTLGFGLAFVLTLFIIGLGLSRLSDVNHIMDRILTKDWKKTTLANEIIRLADDNAKLTMKLMILKDHAQINEALQRTNDNRSKITDKINQLEGLIYTAKGKEHLAKIKEARAPYVTSFTRASQLITEKGKQDEVAQIIMKETLPALERYQGAVNDLVKFQGQLLEESGTEARRAYESGRTLMIGLGALALILGGLFSFLVTRSITRPLSVALDVATQVAAGDMTANIDSPSKDETGQLLAAMQSMMQSLRGMAAAAEKVAQGDLQVQVEARSGKDILSQSFQQLIQTMQSLIAETDQLVQWAKNGQLQQRGDANKFQGGFRELIQGFNGTLDAIMTPINEAATVLHRIAERDLTARMQGEYKGEFAKIKSALNTAASNIDEGLTQVAVGAEQVTSAAGQISAGSQSLAQGASEQASSLEEVSSSLQEMSSMTKQNAANAKEARSLSDGARNSTGKGVSSMQRLSAAIAKIKASSDETAKIVKTIDEIAFQTNLLALNAAVEAARAGDAGKGFAVVAEEVRNLAMRSAEAAKNTANLIEESVKNAESGVAINQEVIKNLEEINGQVHKVGEVMAEIAAASDQQSQGVEQINTAIDQMNQVTQQTAANSEESASAAEELSGQAQEMLSMVTSFQLSNKGLRTDQKNRTKAVVASKLPKVGSQPKAQKRGPSGAGEIGVTKGRSAALEAKKQIPLDEEEDQLVLQEF